MEHPQAQEVTTVTRGIYRVTIQKRNHMFYARLFFGSEPSEETFKTKRLGVAINWAKRKFDEQDET